MMKDGLINPYDGDLTFVGYVMASLPVDVKVAKLFVLGHVFGCLEECLVIGQSQCELVGDVYLILFLQQELLSPLSPSSLNSIRMN